MDLQFEFKAPKWDEVDDWEIKDFGNKVALIDADVYKHLVVLRMYDKMMDEGFDFRTKSNLEELIDSYLRVNIFNHFKCKSYLFLFSAPSSSVFRQSICQEKEYKGNRKNVVDKKYYEGKYEDMAYVFTYINKHYPTLFYDDLEADDLASMLQQEESTFIYSHDKDLKQVPGYHYDPERRVLRYTTEEEGLSLLIGQVLMGDSADNIPGLYRFGEKALEKFNIEYENVPVEQKVFMALKEFINKYGAINGTNKFTEMWMLCSMKDKTGKWVQDKYAEAFETIKTLTNE